MIGATTAIILDQRFKKKDHTYTVKLRVTWNREQKYYPLGKSLTTDQWVSMHSEELRDKELKRLKLLFAKIEQTAIVLIDEMEVFSFPLFEKQFNTRPKSQTDTLQELKIKESELRAAG